MFRAQENERFARDIMRSDLRFVCRDSTYLQVRTSLLTNITSVIPETNTNYQQVAELLDTTELSSIPLVDSKGENHVSGVVKRLPKG